MHQNSSIDTVAYVDTANTSHLGGETAPLHAAGQNTKEVQPGITANPL